MAVIRDYTKLASDILHEVGGEENINNFTRCATRLRLVLHSTPEQAKKNIQSLPGVIAVVESGGQFQVVIGTHVADVFNAMSGLVKEDNSGSAKQPKTRWLDAVIATMCTYRLYPRGGGDSAGAADCRHAAGAGI